MQHQPLPARTAAVGRELAGRLGQRGIGLRLAGRRLDPDRRGVPARQLQRHDGARVADHRAAHQLRAGASGLAGWRGLPGVM